MRHLKPSCREKFKLVLCPIDTAMQDWTFVCPTEIIAFSDRHAEFEALGAQVSPVYLMDERFWLFRPETSLVTRWKEGHTGIHEELHYSCAFLCNVLRDFEVFLVGPVQPFVTSTVANA